MYKSINFYSFQDTFTQMGRSTQFSYEALRALFDYLEEIENDSGQEIELDVVSLCCEYMEIEDDEEEYKEYVGDEAERQDYIIALLPCAVLVRQD